MNVKVAGTQFRRAAELVKLGPADCIPIAAYKAHAAVERYPNLLYAVSVDYALVGVLARELPKALSTKETIVWDLIGKYQGVLTRNAEDIFVFEIVRKYWDRLKVLIQQNPFHIISARKAIRILQTLHKRNELTESAVAALVDSSLFFTNGIKKSIVLEERSECPH